MKNNQVSFWARNIQYRTESHNGTEYVVPVSEQTYLYNPLENEYELLSDALNLGRYLTPRMIQGKRKMCWILCENTDF